ncbi:hypothetical protein OM076_43510 [Solirubrobacter ginsenosidimutans]|uniref:Ig-like domain repeat protein n=1 Tax=Solirubrobacter ginsenosidimutans TaxID=490573 RepID=A0A9X3N4Z0_9ACTN|nr:hypothetical protein [Solirubrobacter ginsenosidimutans]MDA0167208.1 hypothetical protein [Solirubrobacter ginsenosidimutans]
MSILNLRRAGLAVAAVAVSLAVAAPAGANGGPVLPPGGRPYGQTYGQWEVDWWQWVLAQPADRNPVTDTTGAACAAGQPRGPVWFLAGTFGGAPVTRTCRVPSGRALLFPVANNGYFGFVDDPPEQRTEAFVRSITRQVTEATNLTATIDGVPVANIKARYYTESPLFRVVLGANNLLGEPAGFVLDPSGDAGYYLIVPALPRGRHTIRFTSTRPDTTVDVSYRLRVDCD